MACRQSDRRAGASRAFAIGRTETNTGFVEDDQSQLVARAVVHDRPAKPRGAVAAFGHEQHERVSAYVLILVKCKRLFPLAVVVRPAAQDVVNVPQDLFDRQQLLCLRSVSSRIRSRARCTSSTWRRCAATPAVSPDHGPRRPQLSQTTHNECVKSRGRAAHAAGEFYISARTTQPKVNREPNRIKGDGNVHIDGQLPRTGAPAARDRVLRSTPTRAGEDPSGLVELLRALKSGELPAGSESGATEPSTPGAELEGGATDHPSQQSRRTRLNLKLIVPLTTIAMFALPTATAFAIHF